MASLRGEISQLVDVDGSVPSSNLDSFKLHSFYSNLPIYRKKYDWNVPKWTAEDLMMLHKIVRSSVAILLSERIERSESKLAFSENQRLLDVLSRLGSRDLYLIYLNFDLDRLSSKLVDLVRGAGYVDFIRSLTELDSPFLAFKRLYAPNKPRFQDLDLSLFWDSVAGQINSNRKGTMSFKISTDCFVKFLNSTPDGILLTDVSGPDFARIEEFLKKANTSQAVKGCLENSVKLGVTPFQYMKVLLHKGRTCSWHSDEDATLQACVSSEYNVLDGVLMSGNITGVSWKDIARKLPGKTPEQCRLRYRQIKKNPFTDSPFLGKEMVRLRILRTAYGKNWSKIAALMPGRSPRQCMDKVVENTQYTRESALEGLQYFRGFLASFDDYDSDLERPFFVGRYWKHFDWLGLHLIKVLNLTRNPDLLQLLKRFYFSDEIESRIDRAFGPEGERFLVRCSGSEVYSLSKFVEVLASEHDRSTFDKIMNVNKGMVKELFKRCSGDQGVEFGTFDKNENYARLKESVYESLVKLWP